MCKEGWRAVCRWRRCDWKRIPDLLGVGEDACPAGNGCDGALWNLPAGPMSSSLSKPVLGLRGSKPKALLLSCSQWPALFPGEELD